MVVMIPKNKCETSIIEAPGQCILLNVKAVSNNIIVSPKNI